MPHIIKSGVGKGHAAGVNEDNQLYVESKSIKDIAYVSKIKNLSFIFTTSQFSIVTSEYHILWLKVTDSVYELHLDKLMLNWNGGDTNHNRVCFVKIYRGTSTPSANNSVITPSNLKISNSENTDVTVNQWDTVGSGMTVFSNGTNISLLHTSQGCLSVDFNSALIIPKNGVIGITAEGEEAGKLSLSLLYCMCKKEVS
jgi:hypothetical protein